jgi:hypothetical protein
MNDNYQIVEKLVNTAQIKINRKDFDLAESVIF